MSKAEEIAERLEATYDHKNTDEAAAHLRALDASHQRLVEALILMVRTHDEPAETLLQEAKEQQWLAKARAALEQAKDLS